MNHRLARSLFGLTLVASTSAYATPNFPSEVAGKLSISEPNCTLCHQTAAGGSDTVRQPVGMALMERGLVAYDGASLSAALDSLESEQVDSDGDGEGDVAELRAGRNPNRADAAANGGEGTTPTSEGAGETGEPLPPPQYGCAAGGDWMAMGAGTLLVPLLLTGRRKRWRDGR